MKEGEFFFPLFNFINKGKAQALIHKLKYKNEPEIGELLGNWLAERIKASDSLPPFDLIIPIPLHKSKERKRGYNQSAKIAKGISEKLKIPTRMNILYRISVTETQTAKSKVSRIENVRGIFSIKEKSAVIKGKRILLVDDVVTTGSTVLSAYDYLKTNKAESVSIACIARA
ncbi:MAG: ComF family protein [Bacteroidota bacterium]